MNKDNRPLAIVRNGIASIGSFLLIIVMLAGAGGFIGLILLERYCEHNGLDYPKVLVNMVLKPFHRKPSAQILCKPLNEEQRNNLDQAKSLYKQYCNSKDFEKVIDYIPAFKIKSLMQSENGSATEGEVRNWIVNSMRSKPSPSIVDYKITSLSKSYFKEDTIFNFTRDTMIGYIDGDTTNNNLLVINVSYNNGQSWYFFTSGYPNIEDLNADKKSIRREFNAEMADSLFSEIGTSLLDK